MVSLEAGEVAASEVVDAGCGEGEDGEETTSSCACGSVGSLLWAKGASFRFFCDEAVAE